MARNDGSRRRRGGLCDRLFGDLSAKKLRKVLFGAVAAIVTVAVVLFVWNGVVKPVFDDARTESTISVESQLQAAVNIDDLSTAKFHYGGVAVKKDNAGKDKWHVAYEATVTAGVKMSDITFEVDDTAKTVTPILPKPTIGDVVVDSGRLDFFENNPSVEIDEVIKLCKQDAQQETKTNGDIISIAASNLEQTVDALTKDLVEAKGYKLQKAETVKLTKETAHADE